MALENEAHNLQNVTPYDRPLSAIRLTSYFRLQNGIWFDLSSSLLHIHNTANTFFDYDQSCQMKSFCSTCPAKAAVLAGL